MLLLVFLFELIGGHWYLSFTFHSICDMHRLRTDNCGGYFVLVAWRLVMREELLLSCIAD